MVHSQSKKITNAQKKLENLRLQFYGKETTTFNLTHQDLQTIHRKEVLDKGSLYEDLLRIFLFATLTIGVQVLFFLGLKNNFFKIPF